MLEWLITLGAAELGKAVFEQGLKLGQTAAEDYVFELSGLYEVASGTVALIINEVIVQWIS